MKDEPTIHTQHDGQTDIRNDAATFVGMLQAHAVNRRLRKAERTRYLILSKIAERIEQSPTGRITVENLLNDTSLSRGTFYNHFRDTNEGIYVLLALFLETWNVNGQREGRNKDLFRAIFDTNLLYCQHYKKNAAFFAAFSYYASSMSELLTLRNEINAAWAVRIAKAIERRFQMSFSDEENRYLQGALCTLIVMTTNTLEEYFVHRNPLLHAAFTDIYELSFALSRQWYPVMSNPAYSVSEMAHYQTLKASLFNTENMADDSGKSEN